MCGQPQNKQWLKPTVLLCAYGFFSYVKPIEPFITPYLMGARKNFTEDEVVNQIYPVWSYSYMAFLIPIFLLTDLLRYKPIICIQGLGYISCWLLLIYAESVGLMKLMQMCFGLATAAEIGYYSYIYSVVGVKHYQRVTGYARASTLAGLFIGSLLSQLLVSLANVDYQVLNYISLFDVSLAFLISLFLPMPKRTLFFFKQEERDVSETKFIKENSQQDLELDLEALSTGDNVSSKNVPMTCSQIGGVITQLGHDLKNCYSTPSLLRWSVWWMFSTCGWILVVNYIQNLWETIHPSTEEGTEIYNGATESLATLLGALGALFAGCSGMNYDRWGEITLGVSAFTQSVLLLLISTTDIIWVSYGCYIVFITIYNIVITISQYQIAIGLSTEKFALVFGMNTFLAISLNSFLTFIIVDERVLGLNVTTQFVIYSIYFGLAGILYFLYACAGQPCRKSQQNNESGETAVL